MSTFTQDLLRQDARKLAIKIHEQDGKPLAPMDELVPLILQTSAFRAWQRCKGGFTHLQPATGDYERGNVIATESAAWSDSPYDNNHPERGKINWYKLGTKGSSIRQIREGLENRGVDSRGLEDWLAKVDACRIAGRRAQTQKNRQGDKRYTCYTHDVPFMAQIESGPEQVCAIFRIQICIPAFAIIDPMDCILQAEIELLEIFQHGPLVSVPAAHWILGVGVQSEPKTHPQELQRLLQSSIPMLFAGVARGLLENVYYASLEADDFEQSSDPNVSLILNIPEQFVGQERHVANATLKALRNPTGDYHVRGDEIAALASLTVKVLTDAQRGRKLDERQADQDLAKLRAQAKAAQKTSQHPGNEFTLIQIELPGQTVGADGCLYRKRLYEIRDELQREAEISVEKIRQISQIDPVWLDNTADYHAVARRIQAATELLLEHPAWIFSKEDDDFAQECIKTSLELRGLPAQSRKKPPTIWLVIDSATLFPYAETGRNNTNLSAFMERATDPAQPLSMRARPMRLKVASNVLKAHPELETWVNRNGIELVGPQSGFDAGAIHIKLWRKMIDELSWAKRHCWWNGAEALTDSELSKAVQTKVKVHQSQDSPTDEHPELKRIRLFPYNDGLNGVQARKYLTSRQSKVL